MERGEDDRYVIHPCLLILSLTDVLCIVVQRAMTLPRLPRPIPTPSLTSPPSRLPDGVWVLHPAATVSVDLELQSGWAL